MSAWDAQGLDAAKRVSVPESVRKSARDIVGGAWYSDALPDKLSYGRDCWPMGILWTRGGKVDVHLPDLVVMPGDLDEVVALVRLARENAVPIIPYGAGSGVCGGTLPVLGGMVIDVKRLAGIRHLDGERLTVRAGAGSIGMHLETDLNRRGFTMGHYPSSLYCSSLGGYLAARSAGQTSSRYGKIEDMCLSLQAVLGTGDVIESSRFRPDLTRLLIGSEGTLGIITEATMRIEPKAEAHFYRGFQYHSVEAGLEAIRELIQGGFRPAVVRLYDEFDSLMARRRDHSDEDDVVPESMLKTLAKFALAQRIEPVKAGLRWVAKGLVRRALGTPLVLNAITSVLPTGCLLVIGFEGRAGEAGSEARAAFEMAGRYGEDLGEGPGEHWHQNRFNISYKQSPMMDLGAFVDTMEVSTSWDNLLNLYRRVRSAVSRYAFIMAHFSHVYAEGSSIYFTFAGLAEDGQPIEDLYSRTWDVALGAVRQAGASLTHHHGVGLSKAKHLSGDHRGGGALNSLLKARLDPDRIMNPGKLWDVHQRGEVPA